MRSRVCRRPCTTFPRVLTVATSTMRAVGMRPGEILALQWKHVHDDHVQVVHRLYRGIIDRPKSERSNRTVALSSTTRQAIAEWRQQQNFPGPDIWVFPSATGTTPLRRDNAWRWFIAPRLKALQLDWATFQIMRRTHATLSRQCVGPDINPVLRCTSSFVFQLRTPEGYRACKQPLMTPTGENKISRREILKKTRPGGE